MEDQKSQGPAFRNALFAELTRLSKVEHSFATAYSNEENGIVERANQEAMRHLRAILIDARVHDKWSYEQLPMVQRIMNTVEKTRLESLLPNSFSTIRFAYQLGFSHHRVRTPLVVKSPHPTHWILGSRDNTPSSQ